MQRETLEGMEPGVASAQIRQARKNPARELMRIQPAVPTLGKKEVQDELHKILFELTKQDDVIKSRLAWLKSGADTPNP